MKRVFPKPIQRLPEITLPFNGVKGYLVQGKKEQVVFMEFEQETIVPEHTHASQWELVIEGSVNLTKDGQTQTFTKGDCFFIPKGQPHAAVVHKGYHCVIFFDQKDRYYSKEG